MKLTKAEKARLKLAKMQEKTRESKIKTEYYKAKKKEEKTNADHAASITQLLAKIK